MKHTAKQTTTKTLADMYRAIDRRQPVTITYTKTDGTTSVRTVEPYDLHTTTKGDITLVGMDRETSERRTFRIDRISAYTRHTGTTFTVVRAEEVPAPVTPRSEAAIVARELGRDYHPTRTDTTTMITAQIGTSDWHLTSVRASQAGETCGHCSRTLKCLYDVKNTVTGQTMTVGRGCCKKVTGWTLAAAQAKQLLRSAQEKARQDAIWSAFCQAHPDAARVLETDIATWRPTSPGQANIPMHVKYDIARGATPRSHWRLRFDSYYREYHLASAT